MVPVYLGLGSNLGDSSAILRGAYECLAELLSRARLSRMWRSRPMYDLDQGEFVNAAVAGHTDLAPRDLLGEIHRIERTFGRERDVRRPKGPRSLDIDILVYGNLVLDEADLAIPHRSLNERAFALAPLLDLEPALRDPRSGRSYLDILESLSPQGIYLLE